MVEKEVERRKSTGAPFLLFSGAADPKRSEMFERGGIQSLCSIM